MVKKKEPSEPAEKETPKSEFHADMIWLIDTMSIYGFNVDQFAEHMEFPVSYIRNISLGLRPINEELRKVIKEYIKHHPRVGK